MLGWAAIAILSGIDWQIGNRLYPSVMCYDFNLRAALVGGIARHGLPALNALFHPGHAVPLRYHYFWFLPCALIERWSGSQISARQTLIASDVWCGWALMATVAVYLRYFHPAGERGIERRTKWGIALLAVAGLDIIPNLFFDTFHALTGAGIVYASSEWWNTQVTGLPDAVLWVAHHVAAVPACFMGFLLLWRPPRLRNGVCAGLCFASAAGLSIYVAFTFSIFLVVYGAVQLWRKPWPEKLAWIVAGVCAVGCAAPYVIGLLTAGGPPGSFVLPTVRSFAIFDLTLPSFGLGWNQIALANLLMLPLNYFLETGVWFLLAGVWLTRIWMRRRATEREIAALCIFGTSILVATFLKSAVFTNNDLGYRAPLLAQFIVLIWSVDAVRASLRARGKTGELRRWRTRIMVFASLGLASTVYEIGVLRLYLPLADAGVVPVVNWFSPDRGGGRRTYDARLVHEQLSHSLPPGSIIQANSNRWNAIYLGLYGEHQTASFDYFCGTEDGGDMAWCNRIQAQLVPLFNDPGAARKMNVDAVCKAWGIDVLVARDDDPVFRDRSSWVWRSALTGTESVRALRCGGGTSAPTSAEQIESVKAAPTLAKQVPIPRRHAYQLRHGYGAIELKSAQPNHSAEN